MDTNSNILWFSFPGPFLFLSAFGFADDLLLRITNSFLIILIHRYQKCG